VHQPLQVVKSRRKPIQISTAAPCRAPRPSPAHFELSGRRATSSDTQNKVRTSCSNAGAEVEDHRLTAYLGQARGVFLARPRFFAMDRCQQSENVFPYALRDNFSMPRICCKISRTKVHFTFRACMLCKVFCSAWRAATFNHTVSPPAIVRLDPLPTAYLKGA
jgi:hypothetical protein